MHIKDSNLQTLEGQKLSSRNLSIKVDNLDYRKKGGDIIQTINVPDPEKLPRVYPVSQRGTREKAVTVDTKPQRITNQPSELNESVAISPMPLVQTIARLEEKSDAKQELSVKFSKLTSHDSQEIESP